MASSYLYVIILFSHLFVFFMHLSLPTPDIFLSYPTLFFLLSYPMNPITLFSMSLEISSSPLIITFLVSWPTHTHTLLKTRNMNDQCMLDIPFSVFDHQLNASRFYHIPVRMTAIKKSNDNKGRWECVGQGALFHCWWEYDFCSHCSQGSSK